MSVILRGLHIAATPSRVDARSRAWQNAHADASSDDPANPTQIGAESFRADGTWVSVYLSVDQTSAEPGVLPLTAQQLAEIAAAPGLSITG